jgi:single-strand DNA-binding protein
MTDQIETRDRYPDGVLKVHGIGRLGRNPEMRFTPGGKTVLNMNVAITLRTSTPEGFKTGTLWARITVWEALAETCNRWLAKGSRIYFEGRLEFNPETGSPEVFTRSDGTPGTRLVITAHEIRFLGGGEANGQDPAEEQIEFA